MYIALLGRQPELSIAELERVFSNTRWFSASSALFDSETTPNIQRLGGTQKLGRVVETVPSTKWNQIEKAIVGRYRRVWDGHEGKITLGISAYDFTASVPNPRDIQKAGIKLKMTLKKQGTSLRLIPSQEMALSTATSHHNKLGLSDNKVELIIVKGKTDTLIAESVGSQNITALAARDQGRPRRDAFVGMLPPKLAQILINIAAGSPVTEPAFHQQTPQILDPFCGTGVLLQEAALLGYDVYGTDLSEKMIKYTEENLAWLEKNSRIKINQTVKLGDAMDTNWNFNRPVAIAAEAYLGQPFSAPPSPAKLREVQGNCNHIISSFLRNLGAQIPTGTTVVLAVPAWRSKEGDFAHLPLASNPERYGFDRIELQTGKPDNMLYFRPDQVVAREILILKKS